jgi:hypothetical protein
MGRRYGNLDTNSRLSFMATSSQYILAIYTKLCLKNILPHSRDTQSNVHFTTTSEMKSVQCHLSGWLTNRLKNNLTFFTTYNKLITEVVWKCIVNYQRRNYVPS